MCVCVCVCVYCLYYKCILYICEYMYVDVFVCLCVRTYR